jgi:hypothetical protein
MKSKLYLAIACMALILISVQCKKTTGVKTEPMYCNVVIDLKPFYPADTLIKMNTLIYNAATKGEITGYISDSLKMKLTKEEILKKGSSEETAQIADPSDPKGERLIDTVIRTSFNPKEITLNSLSYILKYDDKKGEYQVEFTGFAPCFNLMVAGQNLGNYSLFYVSKEDLVKLFGKEKTTELFANCYKALLQSLNYKKETKPEKITSFHFCINEFVGNYMMFEINKKMYAAVTTGIPAGSPVFPAYQSDSLSKTYTPEEVLGRGTSEENVQIPDPNDPNGTTLIDTVILNSFRPGGNKYSCISFEWKYDAEKMIAIPTINAIGMSLVYEKDKKPAFNTLYWLGWKDANKIYSITEINFLKYTFFRVLGNYNDTQVELKFGCR